MPETTRNLNLVVVGDMNTQVGRELVQAIQSNPDVSTPYQYVHIDEVRRILPGIRATPAVGVVMWASDLQEAVAISDVISTAFYMTSQTDYEAIAYYAMELETAAAMADMGVTEDDLQTV